MAVDLEELNAGIGEPISTLDLKVYGLGSMQRPAPSAKVSRITLQWSQQLRRIAKNG